jgi:hypothetical protein
MSSVISTLGGVYLARRIRSASRYTSGPTATSGTGAAVRRAVTGSLETGRGARRGGPGFLTYILYLPSAASKRSRYDPTVSEIPSHSTPCGFSA